MSCPRHDSRVVDAYIDLVYAGVRAQREARGELVPGGKGLTVSKAEFSAHSLAAILCASGGFTPIQPSPGAS